MKVSILRALKHDYALLGTVIGFVMFFGFAGYLYNKEDLVLIIIFVTIGVACLVFAIYRYTVLSSYFKNGEYIKGEIVDIWFMRDRGRVTYKYVIDGIEYTKGNAIMRTNETRGLSKGDTVRIIVNKDNHEKALIMYLYS